LGSEYRAQLTQDLEVASKAVHIDMNIVIDAARYWNASADALT